MSKINLTRGSNKDLLLDEVFEDFITYSNSKNLSEKTIEYYKINYDQFKSFIDDNSQSQDVTVEVLNQELVEAYRLKLLNQGLATATINSYLRAIRSFLYYTMKFNYIEKFKVNLIRAEDKIKETYTNQELSILLQKPNIEECSFSEYRNWVIINWVLSTGNRSRTLRNIKIEDLDLQNGYVKLRKVKNRKQQIIPISKQMVMIITEYLQFRKGEDDHYLFCTQYGEKLSGEGLKSAIYRYNSRRGLSKTSIHLLRHTFAKLWIKNGGDIFRLQKILGHKNMEMVREYVNMFSEDLKEDFENLIQSINSKTKKKLLRYKMC